MVSLNAQSRKSCTHKNQKGISLFVVISALTILAALTISITVQIMAPTFAATRATQQLNNENDFRTALSVLHPVVRLAAITSLSAQTNLPALDGTPFSLQINGQPMSFILQDVNGLIDVNSASQNLLAAFLGGLGKETLLEAILQKRAVEPFKSVEAVAQVLAIDDINALQHLLTVNSGRRRINSQTAPIELLQILAQQSGNRTQLVAQINKRFFHTRPVTDVLVFHN